MEESASGGRRAGIRKGGLFVNWSPEPVGRRRRSGRSPSPACSEETPQGLRNSKEKEERSSDLHSAEGPISWCALECDALFRLCFRPERAWGTRRGTERNREYNRTNEMGAYM
ncbi:unnamed protein product [Bursaphelenchus okinawaensis]|uniref:Uncharacterized protein n=1 Tax=Bursaphelenchus okinawaensis TaxID=465554 RepID=A0A811K880_9BILA|nr:unnamed protein product [Bursaphelenchus okinawaensis]CAG9093831.1 unnamed protein product [Bursaphelenchus okinawaensis]